MKGRRLRQAAGALEDSYRRLDGKLKMRRRRHKANEIHSGGVPSEQAQNEVASAEEALERDDLAAAYRLAMGGLQKYPGHKRLLAIASQSLTRRGELSAAAQLGAARTLAEHSPREWRRARRIQGRVRETDPRWLPVVSAARPKSVASGESVLYLAKESRPYLNNGFCTRSHESLRSLIQLGVKIEAVTMPGFPGVIGERGTSSVVEGVTYRHLLPSSGTALQELGYDEYVTLSTQVVAGHVARFRPSILHVSSGHRGYETALVGRAVAEWAGLPWVYEVRSFFETTWTAEVKRMDKGEYYRLRFDTETRMMRNADAVVTISGPMRDEIVSAHGISPDKVFVVPNAVDTGRFAPQLRDESLRARLGLRGFVLGYVSNVSHPREGQEVLIRAVAELRRRRVEVSALIVGDGSRLAELSALAESENVADRVVFTGGVPFDDIAQYYAQIDLFVVPRIAERAARLVAPMKPYEAMAMRVPLLLADLPALVEIAGSGDRAQTFRTGDPGSLAEEAEALMDNPAERNRLVETAARWVASEGTWGSVGERFRHVYSTVLDGVEPTRSTDDAGDR